MKLRDLIESNKPKNLCNICQQSFTTPAKLEAHKMITHGPEIAPKVKEGSVEEYQKKIQPTLTPDISKWWEYPPDKIMSFLYWQKNQIPPSDDKLRKQAWESIKSQLQKLYPEPSGQTGVSGKEPNV